MSPAPLEKNPSAVRKLPSLLPAPPRVDVSAVRVVLVVLVKGRKKLPPGGARNKMEKTILSPSLRQSSLSEVMGWRSSFFPFLSSDSCLFLGDKGEREREEEDANHLSLHVMKGNRRDDVHMYSSSST